MRQNIMMNLRLYGAGALLVLQSLIPAAAQTWPSAPIHLIVPFQAGCSTYFLA